MTSMRAPEVGTRLLAGVAVLFLLAGCASGDGVSPPPGSPAAAGTPATAASVAVPIPATPPVAAASAAPSAPASPTAAPPTPAVAAAVTPAPTPTPAPTSQAATIGKPADDGARIIAVDSPKALAHRTFDGTAWVVDSKPVPITRARDLTIESPAVGTVKVRLLLPATFAARPSARWPVLYLLTGGGGSYSDWTEQFDLAALTAHADLLVVMPDENTGGGDGWYSDWWNGGAGGQPAWETFHLVELRQLLERNWQAGDRRAIAGISTGAYGAVEYAARQPGMFRFAGSFSGPLDPYTHFVDFFGSLPADLWGDPAAQSAVWRGHDPLMNAAALKGTALYVAYGNGAPGPLDNGQAAPFDPTGMTELQMAVEGAAFVRRLGELKIPVTVYAYGDGTHNPVYWQRDLHRSFPLILKALGIKAVGT